MKPKRPLRSKTSFMKSISAPIAVFKPRASVSLPDKPLMEVPRYPQIQFVGPTPGTTLENIPEQEGDTENPSSHILTDTPMVSSSPKSDHVFLSPNSEHSASRLPRSPGVEFATTSGFSPRGERHQAPGAQLPSFLYSNFIH